MKATEIKRELREAGIDIKNISVKCDDGDINVFIKTPSICTLEIENILGKYENISRCEITGEIMSDRGTSVWVQYDAHAEYMAVKALLINEYKHLEKTLEKPLPYSQASEENVEKVALKTGFAKSFVKIVNDNLR